MKRIVTISLLLLYVNSNTEFHEILRLPVLFEHFTEHREKSKDLSFVGFLIMHYKKNSVSHDEHDSQLPFKNTAHACASPTLTICSSEINLISVILPTEVHHSSIYVEGFIPSHLSKIFQPPRLS